MPPTDEFARVVRLDPLPLDRAALLLAAHADPACDLDRALDQLDEIAGLVERADVAGLRDAVFGRCGFVGDQRSYYDPRNSYLHTVLDRRRGIPITLALVVLEVGRRVGVPVHGVATPGHFVVGTSEGRFLDAFDGGRLLDRDGLERVVHAVVPGVDISPHLRPCEPVDILRRMLHNLVAIHERSAARDALRWSTELRALLPGASLGDRHAHAGALAACGAFADAADVLDALALDGAVAGAEAAGELEAAAARMRARLN